jgi:Carboxypeptidase regulatory-like domain/TonB-dependent Receptor Plug Domain
MRNRQYLIACLTAFAAPSANAQNPVGAVVSGTVRDSVANQPLASAIVQLVSAADPDKFSRTANADSSGRFSIAGVPDGPYKLGFFHPMLDSLGIEAPLRDVFVDQRRPVRSDLGIPSPATLRRAMCGRQLGARATTDSGAVVVGFVRDARTQNALPNATVSAQWSEVTLSVRGIERRSPRNVVRTTAEGWFLLCDIPGDGPVQFLATAGSDSTDRLEMSMPRTLFMRRDFYVGPTRPYVRAALGNAADSAQRAADDRRMSTPAVAGGMRLTGVVLAAVGGTPVAGAEVRLVDGLEVRANARGEWVMPNVPVGSRMMEMRAVGYFPERRVVDVVEGRAPVRIELATLKAVMDTVKVRATRYSDRNRMGFEERRRQGSGKFVTAADIERRQPFNVSDMLKMQPSVQIERQQEGSSAITIRGAVGDRCAAEFYLDGAYVGVIAAEDLDNLVTPRSVMGIEVYAGATVPAQFSRGLAGGCGVIAVWTK